MKIHIQYIFTEEEKADEELEALITDLDENVCELASELISYSNFWGKIDISSEDKVEG